MKAESKAIALRLVAFGVAIAALLASIGFAIRDGDFQHLRGATTSDLASFLVLTFVSAITLPGTLFWLVSHPFADRDRRLPWWDMQPLVAVSTLLNYTPLKMGLIGRIAYLKRYHGIGYAAAALSHLLFSAALGGAVLLVGLLTLSRDQFDALWVLGLIIGCAALGAGIAFLIQAIGRGYFRWIAEHLSSSGSWFRVPARISGWCAVSSALVLLGAVRWCLAFRIYGEPVTLRESVIISIGHILAAALGPANGLGLREWIVGAVAQSGFLGIGMTHALHVGVSVSIVDRAAEALVIVPSGVLGIIWLIRRRGATFWGGWSDAKSAL